jgi:hypothetical protein
MDIKDYLHLYLPVKFIWVKDAVPFKKGEIGTLEAKDLQYWNEFKKPILRPLSDMTEEELQECGNLVYDFSDDPELNNHKWQDFQTLLTSEQFHWLLKKHFDLFGLIEAGLAIDKTKQP